MGDTESEMMQRLHSPNQQQQEQELNPKFWMPPTSPYSSSQSQSQSQNQIRPPHSRSFSQPSSFFSFDSLPPLSPSPFLPPPSRPDSLPPRKSHRRSNSDLPTCFTSDWSNTTPPPPPPFVKKEGLGVGERESMDDLFSAYMNLDNIDSLNSSEGKESSKTSDTEGETSSVKSVKRRASGGDIAPTTRHYRSLSVDSCFIDKLPPSPGTLSTKVSPTSSVDAASASASFSIEFKNGDFTAAELKKIMANDKLSELAVSDPKRVKRILANRQSAARSKERKMRYIVELEHKVQTLQTEATTLSAQLTLLQRDMMALTNQNNELKFRLQAMEQQARLRDALNEALNGEVQRLKLAIGESSHDEEADSSKMQSFNAEMFQQLNISQLRQQPQSQSQSVTMSTKSESNE